MILSRHEIASDIEEHEPTSMWEIEMMTISSGLLLNYWHQYVRDVTGTRYDGDTSTWVVLRVHKTKHMLHFDKFVPL